MTAPLNRDTLFLLKPDVSEGDIASYCPHSAQIEGLLTYAPELRDHLDVRHLNFPRPRPALVALLGEANQSAPVLVLGDDHPEDDLVRRAGEVAFVQGAREIATFLSRAHGTARPR
ncbi:DUF3088 family protein [Deinococcus hopiensis]|uniref:DUF3088 domain-containing protein n=1 Tax=Deinococcus hopiensis KR-140 TaxID=695939 RepID=A0A1W1UQ51_9DEIO|nr:DUF3088 family protein [Deinococcus hopiensis]SMB83278.1 Protein of unknown function [Deinococcus hopiensis KR-140]